MILEYINNIRKNSHKKAYGAPKLKTELLDIYKIKTTMMCFASLNVSSVAI
jgi:hypothetical protein